jgi:hypothetical protein
MWPVECFYLANTALQCSRLSQEALLIPSTVLPPWTLTSQPQVVCLPAFPTTGQVLKGHRPVLSIILSLLQGGGQGRICRPAQGLLHTSYGGVYTHSVWDGLHAPSFGAPSGFTLENYSDVSGVQAHAYSPSWGWSMASSRPAWAMEYNPVSKTTEKLFSHWAQAKVVKTEWSSQV